MELQKTSILKKNKLKNKNIQKPSKTSLLENLSPRQLQGHPVCCSIAALPFGTIPPPLQNIYIPPWKSRSSSPDLQMDFENLCSTSNLSNVLKTRPPWKNLDISGLQSPVPHPEWQQLRRSVHLMTTRRFLKKHPFGVSKTQTLHDCVANGYKMNKTLKLSRTPLLVLKFTSQHLGLWGSMAQPSLDSKASKNSATSLTLRAIGPLIECNPSRGPDVVVGVRPGETRKPTVPQKAAGVRTEPPISVPLASQHWKLASAAAEPPLLPPAVVRVSHGETVVGKMQLKDCEPCREALELGISLQKSPKIHSEILFNSGPSCSILQSIWPPAFLKFKKGKEQANLAHWIHAQVNCWVLYSKCSICRDLRKILGRWSSRQWWLPLIPAVLLAGHSLQQCGQHARASPRWTWPLLLHECPAINMALSTPEKQATEKGC